MTYVNFEGVCKSFDDGTVAVNGFNLAIDKGEFLVLVGPSGCGKSTTLRMLAGLEEVSSGNIKIDNNIVNDLPPSSRDIGMVFQSYALYPHLNVEKNLGFGLRLQKNENQLSEEEIEERINEIANILGITDILEKMPRLLSGGQRQRVALGRALARRPKVILMDEPLSNLDAKLRNQMRVEIRRLHDEIGMTTIYVTHDQMEAMTLGDRLVVMEKGIIQQVDKPLEAYHRPKNTFVASFLGTPPMNLLEGNIDKGIFSNEDIIVKLGTKFEGKCTLGIRPENIKIVKKNGLFFDIIAIEKLGAEWIYHLKNGSTEILSLWHRPGYETANMEVKKLHISLEAFEALVFDVDGNLVPEG